MRASVYPTGDFGVTIVPAEGGAPIVLNNFGAFVCAQCAAPGQRLRAPPVVDCARSANAGRVEGRRVKRLLPQAHHEWARRPSMRAAPPPGMRFAKAVAVPVLDARAAPRSIAEHRREMKPQTGEARARCRAKSRDVVEMALRESKLHVTVCANQPRLEMWTFGARTRLPDASMIA